MNVYDQIKRIAGRRLKDAEEVAQTSLINLGNEIINSTPVDKGGLINSWMSNIGGPSLATRGESVSGGDSSANLQEKAITLNLGSDFYFTNSMPYAARIEYTGFSQKAPDGMVRINTLRWESIVEKEIQRRQ